MTSVGVEARAPARPSVALIAHAHATPGAGVCAERAITALAYPKLLLWNLTLPVYLRGLPHRQVGLVSFCWRTRTPHALMSMSDGHGWAPSKALLDSGAALMGLQLRSLVVRSLQQLVDLFERCDLSGSGVAARGQARATSTKQHASKN